MLAQSSLLSQLQQFVHTPNVEPVCFYGDKAYPLRIHLQAHLEEIEHHCKKHLIQP